jgi:protein SCO1/2
VTYCVELESEGKRQESDCLAATWGVMLYVAAALVSSSAWCAPANLYDLPNMFTDDQARQVRLSEWRGKPMIVTMEYSNCRFMCSTTFSQMQALQAAADEQHNPIDFMIISLDPDNDTPEAWRQYRQTKNIERANWHLLTGSRATTKQIAALLGIKYWSMDEHILHDFKVVRLNANGAIEKEITAYGVEPNYLLH